MDKLESFFNLFGITARDSDSMKSQIRGLTTSLRSDLFRACKHPCKLPLLRRKSRPNKDEENYFHTIFITLIELYQESPEIFGDHDLKGLDLAETEITTYSDMLLKKSGEVLGLHPEHASRIATKASEQKDGKGVLYALLDESEKLSHREDLRNQLSIEIIPYDDATIALLATCSQILSKLLNDNYDLNFKKYSPTKMGFLIIVPERLIQIATVSTLYVKNLKPYTSGMALLKHRGYTCNLIADDSRMHNFVVAWAPKKFVEDPKDFVKQ